MTAEATAEATALEHTQATALRVLDRFREMQHPARRFIAPVHYSGACTQEEFMKLLETGAQLENELASAIEGPVFDFLRRRVREATSVDELDRLMKCITGMQRWNAILAM